MSDKKTRILYLFPGPTYRPDLPDFKDRFEMLSDFCEGEIYSWTWDRKYSHYQIGGFNFHGFVWRKSGFLRLRQTFFILKNIFKSPDQKKFDVIVCYDPIFTGLLGVLLKWVLKTKLIVEVNNFSFRDSLRAHSDGKNGAGFKAALFEAIQRFVFRRADRIKVLTEGQKQSLKIGKYEQKISVFHDFVPTHFFQQKKGEAEKGLLHNSNFGRDPKRLTVEEFLQPSKIPAFCNRPTKEILCVGWPFYLKGMDVLINAFQKISLNHPDVTLKLIGHHIEEDARKHFNPEACEENFLHKAFGFVKEIFKRLCKGSFKKSRPAMAGRVSTVISDKVTFLPGLFYDELREHFLNCYCLVLPSRTEGMGRVLIEAMACGKPVIGSNVGGIPFLIQNGKNGYLINPADEKDLADKLDLLLSDENKAVAMGQRGKQMVDEKYSSDRYCECFKTMIRKTAPDHCIINDRGQDA